MTFELIIAIALIVYLRKSLQTKSQLPRWDKVLTYLLYGVIALLIVTILIKSWNPVTKWVSHILLLYLIYILYAEKVFSKYRPLLYAIAPYIILSLFIDITKLTAKGQYTTWKNILEVAHGFSFIWMIAMWFITGRQRRALDKEQTKTREEEAQRKLMESMNEQLEKQVAERTAELTRQKEELQHTLEELKSMQSQLIQSEKMASLGELTAGIAHEIQNPLNFVNNFSEVSNELIAEMNDELNKGAIDEAKSIGNDIRQNLEKINYHGKRADAIVKAMLQHSRKNSGIKEPTDINALCDEYLRLSYHGLRAKDKSFNAKYETDFDDNIGKINIVPQDIGRVILNLINNAFYTVSEKQKQNIPGYIPTVVVKTSKHQSARIGGGAEIMISISDNGNGIPQNIIGKIFQPFFTTKPTGQGTGLGLSLSYDIITRGHKGELKVESEENKGTTFIIKLPIQNQQ